MGSSQSSGTCVDKNGRKIYCFDNMLYHESFRKYPRELLQDLKVEKIFNGTFPYYLYCVCGYANKDIIKKYITANLAIKKIKSLPQNKCFSLCDDKDPMNGEEYMLLFIDDNIRNAVIDSIENRKAIIWEQNKRKIEAEEAKRREIFMEYISKSQQSNTSNNNNNTAIHNTATINADGEEGAEKST